MIHETPHEITPDLLRLAASHFHTALADPERSVPEESMTTLNTYHGTAREVVDIVLERAIKALRTDCRVVPKFTRSEWELFFARAGALAAEDLNWLDDRLSLLEKRLIGASNTLCAIEDLIEVPITRMKIEDRTMKTCADIRSVTATLPPRLLIHGLEGTGKTTLAAQFPKPVFLQTEDGTPGKLELASFGLLEDLNGVREAITALGNEANGFRTLVLDSLDALEPLIWSAVCREHSWSSIEAPGYGKGYVETDTVWRDLLAGFDWLRRRGMIIVLIAHSAVETINDPRAPSYTSYQLRVHKRARALLQDWADAIGFLANDVVVKSEDVGFGRKRVRADGGSQRYLHFEARPAFTAKSRYALPAKLPVSLDFDFTAKLAPLLPTAAPERAVPLRAAGGTQT
jgi:hypothetical protein